MGVDDEAPDLSSSSIDLTAMHNSIDNGEIIALQGKTCEICLNFVFHSKTGTCCINGHKTHHPCLAKHLAHFKSPIRPRCPLCRSPCFRNVREGILFMAKALRDHDLPLFEKYSKMLGGHLEAFKLLGRDPEPELCTEMMMNLIFYGEYKYFHEFTAFSFGGVPLVNVNSLVQAFGGHCPISFVMKIIWECQSSPLFIEKLPQFFSILVGLLNDFPGLVLNRVVSGKHLVLRAIDANLFGAFVEILNRSPGLDWASVLRYVVTRKDRDRFLNYLLQHQDHFDIFAEATAREVNLIGEGMSALHVAVRFDQYNYVAALVESTKFIPTLHLYSRNQGSQRTVLHTAVLFARDEILSLLLTGREIQYGVTDYYGTTLDELLYNRTER